MRVFLNCVLLLPTVTVLISCNSETDISWTVTGHLIKADPSSEERPIGDGTNLPLDTTPDEIAEMDLSTASISINHYVTDEAGETITVELGSGKFEDETVKLHGIIDKLTEVEIIVELDSENVMTTTAMIGPGSNVSFALIDSSNSDLDRLVLYGVSNRALNPTKKFVISGDLQDIGRRLINLRS